MFSVPSKIILAAELKVLDGFWVSDDDDLDTSRKRLVD